MKDRSENNHSMGHAVNDYLASPAATLLMANATVTARKATLVIKLGEAATLIGTLALLTGEGLGATAAKRLSRLELNRLILKISHGLRSAFRSLSDIENATAVTLDASTVTRARDQDLPQFATLLTNKATLVGPILTTHNITSAELSTLATAAAGWGVTSGKGTGKRAGSKANRKAAEDKIEEIVTFLQEDLDPIIKTFQFSAVEAERTAAAGYFAARVVLDLHGPGSDDDDDDDEEYPPPPTP